MSRISDGLDFVLEEAAKDYAAQKTASESSYPGEVSDYDVVSAIKTAAEGLTSDTVDVTLDDVKHLLGE